MKTQILIRTILLSIMLTFSVSAWADGNDTIPPTPPTPPNPVGDRIEIPLNKIIYQRTPIEPIQAYYYIGEYTIEMEFNENIGDACIQVVNSAGVVIYNFTHDPAIEGGCPIFLPPNRDCYYIQISAHHYQATGELCI